MQSPTVRVAVTQLEPEWIDLQSCIDKVCTYIAEAAQNGAKLVTFPECFVPGYPAWIWSRPVDHELATRYIRNSLRRDSPEMRRIQASAAENMINVALGFSENDNNSLYIAQALLSSSGEMLFCRRKMKPTHMERTIFGESSGDSLLNVHDVGDGVGRVGCLNCWEHIQPLLKFHTFSQHEELHVAAWPPLMPYIGSSEFWSISREGCRALCQTYAVESQTFVLHTTAVISQKGIDTMQCGPGLFGRPGGGSSAIFAPDGRQLSVDIPETEEGVIYLNLDLDMILIAKSFADATGHYSRPDLLSLTVNTKSKKIVTEVDTS